MRPSGHAHSANRLVNNAMAQLAVALREQGFEVPLDPIDRDDRVNILLTGQALTDAVWIAIRDKVHAAIAREDALHERLGRVYRLLLPNCGAEE